MKQVIMAKDENVFQHFDNEDISLMVPEQIIHGFVIETKGGTGKIHICVYKENINQG